VAEWREEGKADIVPGVLFIDEARAAAAPALEPRAWSHGLTLLVLDKTMPAKERCMLSCVASEQVFCCVKA
jgi:hypothetical protein